jgi:hypothetical protein
MPAIGPHLRIIHDSQHAATLAAQDRKITPPRGTSSQLTVVVLGGFPLPRRPFPQLDGCRED